MNRSTTLWKIFFLLCLPLFGQAQPFLLPDLQISGITVTKVDGDDFSFKYTIKNGGTLGLIYLKRFYFQAYVSQDAVLDGDDLPAGGSIFGDDAPALPVGQTYSGTWSSNPSGSIEDYHYLIFDVKLRSGQSQAELTTSNNRFVKDLRPSFADLLVGSVKVESIDVNSKIKLTYGIRNIGASTLHLDRFTYELYLSSNSSYSPNSDIYAGTGTLNHGSGIFAERSLEPGEVDTFTVYSNAMPTTDLNKYPYLLFRAHAHLPEPQKSVTNDATSDNYVDVFPTLNTDIYQITSFNENQVSFIYNLPNYGGGNLFLERFVGKLYVSANSTLEPGEDLLISEKNFVNAPYVLKPGAIYTFQSTYTASLAGVDLEQRPYLILEASLKPGKLHHIKGAIKTDAYYLGPYHTDLVMGSITAQSVSYPDGLHPQVKANFSVANYGKKELDLHKYQYSVYLSQNPSSIVGPSDVFIKTIDFNLPEAQRFLAYGEQTLQIPLIFTADENIDPVQFHFLILRASLKPGETDVQSYYGNDLIWTNLQQVFLFRMAAEENFTVTQEEEGIQLEAKEGQQQPSAFALYSLSGEKVAEGTFTQQKQISTTGMSSGLYILSIVSNGSKENHKVMIQE